MQILVQGSRSRCCDLAGRANAGDLVAYFEGRRPAQRCGELVDPLVIAKSSDGTSTAACQVLRIWSRRIVVSLEFSVSKVNGDQWGPNLTEHGVSCFESWSFVARSGIV